MTTPGPRLLVLAGRNFACIKIVGRADFNSSIDFRTLVQELQNRGFSYFVLDVSECPLMDSTFLGVLAGFGLKMSDATGEPNRQIELYKPNARVVELLENLGILHLFRISQGDLALPGDVQTHTHDSCQPTKEEITRACLEAHETLMAIDPGNIAKFKDVARFLAEDLKGSKAGSP